MAMPEYPCYYHYMNGSATAWNPFPYNYTAMAESQAPSGFDCSAVMKPDRDKVVSKRPFLGDFRPWEREYDPSTVISTSYSSIQHSYIQNVSSISSYEPPTFAPMATPSILVSNYTWPAPNYCMSPENQPTIPPYILNSSLQDIPTSVIENPFVSSSQSLQLPSFTTTPTTQQPPNPDFSYKLLVTNNEPKVFDERSEGSAAIMESHGIQSLNHMIPAPETNAIVVQSVTCPNPAYGTHRRGSASFLSMEANSSIHVSGGQLAYGKYDGVPSIPIQNPAGNFQTQGVSPMLLPDAWRPPISDNQSNMQPPVPLNLPYGISIAENSASTQPGNPNSGWGSMRVNSNMGCGGHESNPNMNWVASVQGAPPGDANPGWVLPIGNLGADFQGAVPENLNPGWVVPPANAGAIYQVLDPMNANQGWATPNENFVTELSELQLGGVEAVSEVKDSEHGVQNTNEMELKADSKVESKAESDTVEFTVKDGYFCPALSQAVKRMKKGEKALLTVKPQHAFGEEGRAATRDESTVHLNFWTKLLSVQKQWWEFKPKHMENILIFKLEACCIPRSLVFNMSSVCYEYYTNKAVSIIERVVYVRVRNDIHGEVIFVPNGWWHLLINPEDPIAITQNFGSRRNLLSVCDFLNKPNADSLMSGTRDRVNLYDKFKNAIKTTFPGIIDQLVLKAEMAQQKKPSFWESVTVFCSHELLWRNLVLENYCGFFLYNGSWKFACIAAYRLSFATFKIRSLGLKVRDFYSDYLFQSWLDANLEMKPELLERDNILQRKGISVEKFVLNFEELNKPVLLEGCLQNWAAWKKWDMDYLVEAYGDVVFSVGPVEMKLENFFRYSDQAKEERPLFLFDPKFAEEVSRLNLDYEVPVCFNEDLFSVLGNERPDYRWIIIGPAGFGASFHIVPNSTSVWNTVIKWSKKWAMFPPDVMPPGVHPSLNGAEVACPVSIIEWFMNFYSATKKWKKKPFECVCKASVVIIQETSGINSNAEKCGAIVLKLWRQDELDLGYCTTPLVFDPGGNLEILAAHERHLCVFSK